MNSYRKREILAWCGVADCVKILFYWKTLRLRPCCIICRQTLKLGSKLPLLKNAERCLVCPHLEIKSENGTQTGEGRKGVDLLSRAQKLLVQLCTRSEMHGYIFSTAFYAGISFHGTIHRDIPRSLETTKFNENLCASVRLVYIMQNVVKMLFLVIWQNDIIGSKFGLHFWVLCQSRVCISPWDAVQVMMIVKNRWQRKRQILKGWTDRKKAFEVVC